MFLLYCSWAKKKNKKVHIEHVVGLVEHKDFHGEMSQHWTFKLLLNTAEKNWHNIDGITFKSLFKDKYIRITYRVLATKASELIISWKTCRSCRGGCVKVRKVEMCRCEGAECVFPALKEQLRVALHATGPSRLSVTDCVVRVIYVDMLVELMCSRTNRLLLPRSRTTQGCLSHERRNEMWNFNYLLSSLTSTASPSTCSLI